MITAFVHRESRFEQVRVQGPEDLSPDALWIDLVAPTAEEREWARMAYGIDLPTPDEMLEIEASARFYEDADGLNLLSYFLHDIEESPRNVNLALILSGRRLFTVHDEDVPALRYFRFQARRQPTLAKDAVSVMLGLFEGKVEQLAGVLEDVYGRLEKMSSRAFGAASLDLEDVLSDLAALEDLNSKVRLSLMDSQRVLSFLLRRGGLSQEQVTDLREILRDIRSLIEHSGFIFERVHFLMNTTMGLINVQQNNIIKIFSIVAVVFLPPTLIASIYGMNLESMKAIFDMPYGFALSLLLMVGSMFAPYWYFRKKGWL